MPRHLHSVSFLAIAAAFGSVSSLAGAGPEPVKLPPAASGSAALASPSAAFVIGEASLEYFISLAAKLTSGDSNANLAALKQRLSVLKQQKQGLITRITQLESQIAGAEAAQASGQGKPDAIQALRDQVAVALAQLAAIDAEIKKVLADIAKANADDAGADASLAHTTLALKRILASIESTSATDRATWQSVTVAKKRDHAAAIRRALAQLEAAAAARAARLKVLPSPSSSVK